MPAALLQARQALRARELQVRQAAAALAVPAVQAPVQALLLPALEAPRQPVRSQ